MRIIICDNERKKVLNLPSNVEGSFWIKENQNDKNILANVNSENGVWIMSSNHGPFVVHDGSKSEKVQLQLNSFYFLQANNKRYVICVEDTYDTTFRVFKFEEEGTLSVGKDATNNVVYNNPCINSNHAVLHYIGGGFKLVIVDNSLVFKNDIVINQKQTIVHNGNVLYLFGLRIIIVSNMIIINNPGGNVQIKNNKLKEVQIPFDKYIKNEDSILNKESNYIESDYFFKKPRIRRYIKTIDFNVASPPQKREEEDTPLLLVIGPMLTMGVISFVSLLNVSIRILSGQTTFAASWTTFVIAITMLTAMVLWPNLTRAYQRKKAKMQEKKRVTKYHKYMDNKKQEIQEMANLQKNILNEKLLTVEQCCKIISNKTIELWDRLNTQKDFLSVRIGRGDTSLDANIIFSEEEFSMDEDQLKIEAENIVHEAMLLKDVPIEYSFKNNKATAIMGDKNKIFPFTRNVLLQLITFHSYDDLKIIFLVDEDNQNQWSDFKNLPHCFSDDKDVRFFATNIDEMKIIDRYIEREYINRITDERQKELIETEEGNTNYKPYYLIVTDDYSKVRKLNMDNLILDNKPHMGFSFLILGNQFGHLPSGCLDFINLSGESSEVLKNNSEEYSVFSFKDEINDYINYSKYCEILANISIELASKGGQIPETLSFLEMFSVGKVEQLNTLTRWEQNDPTQSLRALVGVGHDFNRIYLDLHEKHHGPHGLIAGMTGSGKSEFIITYILSMALNYSPKEVSFILIDYKGGGLAGAFENKALNVRLPHLSGVITNLDKTELNRTLVSINSELQKRQELFNKARDELGESTMDIYKYQRFYREGKLKKAISHLFIISDEFAELKSQQPEFMSDLISAARIGRSLGVHLILATQKPSGVVNDQIWSNTKFRICLKVQDRSDSNEMLKRPDAAEIQNAGRFYLQVGYDELFTLGQSGYAGIQYKPSDFAVQEEDDSIIFINNLGQSVKEVIEDKPKVIINTKGDQLSNTLKYIYTMAEKVKVKADKLWLDSIPKDIYVEKLIQKYKLDFQKNVVAVIGEYDDPARQNQNILTLTLSNESNTIVFGRNSMDREMFLNSIIYSLCTKYKTENINLYIMDFGSETLRMFSGFPQVGDVMLANDVEKINKTFTVINDLIVERKSLFADYNGDYFNYCRNSGKTVPLFVFIINNWESFMEIYGKYEHDIIRYSREGRRYGVITIITSNTAHGFPNRIMRNFNNIFALELPGKTDYMEIYGKIGNLYPSDFPGRGMFQGENICEFQTAQIYNGDDIVEFLKQEAVKVRETCGTSAPVIPVLPEKVTLETLFSNLKGATEVPIGIEKQSLNPSLYDLKQTKFNIISAVEPELIYPLIRGIVTMITTIPDTKTVLVDLNKGATDSIDIVTGYCDDNFSVNSESIIEYINKNIYKNSKNNLVLIIAGVDKLLTTANKNALKKLISKITSLENATVIMADSAYQMKKLSMETWYSSEVRKDNGIWIGNGLLDQTILKLSGANKTYGEKIGDNFAWKIKNGQGILIKLMEMNSDE